MMKIAYCSKQAFEHLPANQLRLYAPCAGSLLSDEQATSKGIKVIDIYNLANLHTTVKNEKETIIDLFRTIRDSYGIALFQCDFGRSRSYEQASIFAILLDQPLTNMYYCKNTGKLDPYEVEPSHSLTTEISVDAILHLVANGEITF